MEFAKVRREALQVGAKESAAFSDATGSAPRRAPPLAHDVSDRPKREDILNTHSTLFLIVLVLNVLWFGAGFWQFFLRPDAAARTLVPRTARDSPVFTTLAASIRFLGGLNLAFCIFSALLLANFALFPDTKQLALFAAVFSLAHGSQFCVNVPIAWSGGRQGESYWPVLSGPMLFIFVVDGVLMVANGTLAATLFAATTGTI